MATIQTNSRNLDNGEVFFSSYWPVAEVELGCMVAFHASAVEGGVHVTVHKNGAHDEQIDEFTMEMVPHVRWVDLLILLNQRFRKYVEDL